MLKANLSPGILKKRVDESQIITSILLIGGLTIILFIIGVILGTKSSYIPAIITGICAIAIMLVLRQDELAAVSVLIVHLYVDWYLGLLLVGPLLTSILLVFFFLARSPQHPWSKPRALWLWVMFLTLAIYPAFHGSLTRYDAAYYYPNIMLGALLTFWLGIVLAKDPVHTERFFKILAVVATALAIITIIQNITGVLLFGTSRFDVSLAEASDYNIFQGSNVFRLGSFFVNPDWNGAFFATMLCVPLGLFTASKSIPGKILYLAETLVIIPALLFTYSVGSWISAGAGLLILLLLAGCMSYRAWIILFLATATAVLLFTFPEQIALLLKHGSDPTTLELRNGAWETAIRVIQAFPLTGIGLGIQAYMLRAEPYRVPLQFKILAHPHNSYLELGAMAGLPVLAAFVALLTFALWLALCHWMKADKRQRVALGSGIAAIIALSINSFSVNVWTLPPLAALGWLLLGVVSSPLLAKSQENSKEIITGKVQK